MYDLIFFGDGDDRKEVRLQTLSTLCREISEVKRFFVHVPVLSVLTGAKDANPVNETMQLLLEFETEIQEAWRSNNFTRVVSRKRVILLLLYR